MPMLHLLNHSPAEQGAWARCLMSLAEGDALLLLEDGVYAALPGALSPSRLDALRQARVRVLEPDLEARGLSDRPLNAGFRPIDFAGFVDLIAAHEVSVSWGRS